MITRRMTQTETLLQKNHGVLMMQLLIIMDGFFQKVLLILIPVGAVRFIVVSRWELVSIFHKIFRLRSRFACDSKIVTCLYCASQICGKNAQQIQLDLQIDLYKDGLVTTIPRLLSKIILFSQFLHPTHGLVLTAKRSLVQCYSQLSAESVNRGQLEVIRHLCQQQLGNANLTFPTTKRI